LWPLIDGKVELPMMNRFGMSRLWPQQLTTEPGAGAAAASFDDLVGEVEPARRNSEAERLGGLQVDDQR